MPRQESRCPTTQWQSVLIIDHHLLIDSGISGAYGGIFEEPEAAVWHLRSFVIDLASAPVEIGALLALSRVQRDTIVAVECTKCFFSRDSDWVSTSGLHHPTGRPTAGPGRYAPGGGARFRSGDPRCGAPAPCGSKRTCWERSGTHYKPHVPSRAARKVDI